MLKRQRKTFAEKKRKRMVGGGGVALVAGAGPGIGDQTISSIYLSLLSYFKR